MRDVYYDCPLEINLERSFNSGLNSRSLGSDLICTNIAALPMGPWGWGPTGSPPTAGRGRPPVGCCMWAAGGGGLGGGNKNGGPPLFVDIMTTNKTSLNLSKTKHYKILLRKLRCDAGRGR